MQPISRINGSTAKSDEFHDQEDHRASSPVVKFFPHSTGVSCGSCRLNELCLPIALNEGEMQQLDDIVERNRPHQKGEHLYRQHDPFKSIFAVRSGSFKSYVLNSSGGGRVTGFYLPGEIIGMDGIADRTHANSAIALEHASICEIPFNQLESLSQKLPVLQHNFFSIMGAEITKDQKIHTVLSSYSAEQRVVSFLLGISSRYARVGLSPLRFHLPMTRGDIGEYLGLTVETVSRLLTALQKKDLITVDNREIALLDKIALEAIVGADSF